MIRRDIANNSPGFTIVELFLVISIFGIILLSIFASYSAGFKVWRMVNRVYGEIAPAPKIKLNRMRKEISSYVRDYEKGNLKGDKNGITFPCVVDGYVNAVEYVYDRGDRALLRKAYKLSDSLKDKMAATKTKVIGADEAVFSYLVMEKDSDTGRWVSGFSDEENGILLSVKVEFTLRGAEAPVIEYYFVPV